MTDMGLPRGKAAKISACLSIRWLTVFPAAVLLIALAGIAGASADVVAPPRVAVSETGTLRVVIDGTEPGTGTVRVNLYASAGSFLRVEDAQASVEVGEDGTPEVTFESLSAGRYAVVAYHDLNGNAELDRGFLGVPLEPLGFSNDALPVFSAPAFADAAFMNSDGDDEIRIILRYLGGGRPAGS